MVLFWFLGVADAVKRASGQASAIVKALLRRAMHSFLLEQCLATSLLYGN